MTTTAHETLTKVRTGETIASDRDGSDGGCRVLLAVAVVCGAAVDVAAKNFRRMT